MEQNRKKKNLITINQKLVVDETDDSFYTRIPFTKDDYVEFSKENCKWLSEHTMQVEIKDNDTIHKIQKETTIVDGKEEECFQRTGSNITGEELKKHYDDVYERQALLGTSDRTNNTSRYLDPDDFPNWFIDPPEDVDDMQFQSKYNRADNYSEIEHSIVDCNKIFSNDEKFEEVEKKNVEQAKDAIFKVNDFDIHTYKNEELLKFYPEELKQDKEFIQALTYKEMQENYLTQYTKQNSNTSNITEAIEHTKENITLANAVITEKIDAYIENSKILNSASQSFKDNFSTIDKEYFKSLTPELQQSETFREVYSLYSAQKNYCELLKNTIDCYQDHIQTLANSDKMSDNIAAYNLNEKVENTIVKKYNESALEIQNTRFAMEREMSKYQNIKPHQFQDNTISIYSMYNQYTPDTCKTIARGKVFNIYQNTSNNAYFVGVNRNNKINALSGENKNIASIKAISLQMHAQNTVSNSLGLTKKREAALERAI